MDRGSLDTVPQSASKQAQYRPAAPHASCSEASFVRLPPEKNGLKCRTVGNTRAPLQPQHPPQAISAQWMDAIYTTHVIEPTFGNPMVPLQSLYYSGECGSWRTKRHPVVISSRSTTWCFIHTPKQRPVVPDHSHNTTTMCAGSGSRTPPPPAPPLPGPVRAHPYIPPPVSNRRRFPDKSMVRRY